MKSKKYKIVNKRRFYLFVTFVLTIGTIIIFSIFNSVRAHSDFIPNPYFEVKVIEGDTLWNIAKEYLPLNYDIRKMIYNIKEINEIESANIYPGDIIKIPIINK